MDLASNFEELMQRSPISQHEMKSLLKEMRRTQAGTVTVSKLLAGKIQGSSEAQAIQAFELLEAALESESEGSIEFRTEIGRYRFLNEIIRILSPKYLGDKTPGPVKERAIKFLEDAAGGKRRRWFPSEHSKVNSVYQSLVDGGIIHKASRVIDEDAEFQKNIFERGENAVILKRLLQSKDPSDLQAANRLIKNLVDEEARRNERRAELHSLIDRIETSTGLLTDMLTQSNIDKELVEELVETCRSLRQKLGGVATETNEEATSLLQASENIETVLMLYDSKKESLVKAVQDTVDSSELPAGASGVTAPKNPELSLADQLLMNLGDETINGMIKKEKKGELSGDSENLLLNLNIDFKPLKSSPSTQEVSEEPKNLIEPFDELNKLSRELMEEELKGLPNSGQKKTDKTPLSLIRKTSLEIKSPVKNPLQPVPVPNPINGLLDLDFLDKPVSDGKKSTGHDQSLSSKENSNPRLISTSKNENLLLVLENDKSKCNDAKVNGILISSKTTPNETTDHKVNGSSDESNTTSNFCLNSVKDLDLEKIELMDGLQPIEPNLEESCKDVNLTITFATYPNFPKAVSLAVVTLTNQSKSTGLLNYVFQLLPPKGLQVKLLPPVCMELPPWKKTFLPPPILSQIALISIPKKPLTQPNIKFILSYSMDDETVLHNGSFSLPTCLLQ